MKLVSALKFILGSLLLFCVGVVSAQTQQPPATGAPRPAARSLPSVGGPEDNTVQTPEGTLQPDTTPLTGILTPSLGTPQLEHSFVLLGAQIGSTVQSGGIDSGGWFADNYFLGNLNLVKNWRRGITSINYSGGGYVSSRDSSVGTYQNLSFMQDYHVARWDFSLVDAFNYLPQSQFGFGGGTNLGVPGTGSSIGVPTPGVGGGPNQDIFSASGPRYTNTAAAQGNYTLSPRNSLTFNGSYGILRFTDSTASNNDTFSAGLGYNRQLTKADSLGVFYNFGGFHYSGSPQAYGSQSVGLAYGRKITGKLALRLSAGPQINSYRIPVNGDSSVISAYANASLSYGLRNGSMNLTYDHGLSNGSGVLVGSQRDQATFAASRRLGRVWSGFTTFGFSRNTPIGGSSASNNQSYNDWFLGGGVTRPFGRSVSFAVAYTANLENVQKPACTTGSCTIDLTQHIITLSLQWHTRPFVLH